MFCSKYSLYVNTEKCTLFLFRAFFGFSFHVLSHNHLIFVESHEEGDDDEGDDDEDDEGDEAEEAGEENDRPYNLRQRKTVQRYESPPIGTHNYLPVK